MQPPAEFDWKQLCNNYMNSVEIRASDVVAEISRHDNWTNSLISLIHQIHGMANWENNGKLRELERQSRLKLKDVTGLTPKDYGDRHRAIERSAKRARDTSPSPDAISSMESKRKPKGRNSR